MNAATETGEALAAPAAPAHATRPFYWSIRRELWESRSLIIAPLVGVGVILLGMIIAAMHLSHSIQALGTLPTDRQHAYVSGTFLGVGFLMMWIMGVTVFFYCLDALHSERRDRSILFWKSMPVSDLTTVLTKLFTASVVAPAIAFVCILMVQFGVLIVASVAAMFGGSSIAAVWNNLQLVQITIAMLYTLVGLSLWFLPVYAWLLLVSAWAKRSVFLWAVLPPVAIIVFERLAFGSLSFARLLEYRLQDGMKALFVKGTAITAGPVKTEIDLRHRFPDNVLEILDPARFLSNPDVWLGVAVAGAFVAAAIWMRRYREPI